MCLEAEKMKENETPEGFSFFFFFFNVMGKAGLNLGIFFWVKWGSMSF